MLTFDAEKHEYRWDGEIVPSVTQIIRTMPDWREHGGADSEYHMSVGTAVHEIVSGRRSLGDYGEEHRAILSPYVESWRRGVEAFAVRVPSFDSWEIRTWHKAMRYAGTVDAIGFVTGPGECVIDLKTGAPAWWHPLQTAAYAACGGWPHRCAVYLSPDGDLPKLVWHNDPGDFAAFAGWLNYARRMGVITT